MESHPIEKEVGIETYLTQVPGVGGKLRVNYKDFIVEEITVENTILESLTLNKENPAHDLDLTNLSNRYSTYHVVLEKVNLETFTAIQKLAIFLHLPHKNIGYAGLKDKRAVTVQQISISGANPQLLTQFQSSGIYLNRIRSGKPISLGDLNGNHFQIILRQLTESFDQTQKKIEQIKQQILDSYIPNYYGPQRFGALRPITHLIGRSLLRGDFEAAIKIYLTALFSPEEKETQEIRTVLRDSWPQADVIFPKKYYYENRIIHFLKENHENFKKLFKKIFPPRYFLLFIHAYQSYLFNKLLSARITHAHLPFDQAFEGDSVAILNEYSLPTQVIYEVNSKNISYLNNAIKKGKAVVMAPLFGYDFDYSRHPLADYIAELLKQENFNVDLFKSSSNPSLDFKVIYRPILFKPKDFTITSEGSPSSSQGTPLKFTFSITKGSYATILLREFMKTNPLNY